MSCGNIIGILQPVYLPWLGYFEQIASVDHFLFLDDVQYTRQDWRNRNRVKTASGPVWLTVPIENKHSLQRQIRDIQINNQEDWRKRHLKTISQNYGKCPHFQPFFDELAHEISVPTQSLLDLDVRLIQLICKYLDIHTPMSFSSELPSPCEASPNSCSQISDKNRRLIDICRYLKADRFYEGAKGVNYIDIERFRQAGIEVIFQNYQHPVYRQAFGPFLSHQSAIDLIMNVGPDAPAILRSSPAPALLRRPAQTGRVPVGVEKETDDL